MTFPPTTTYWQKLYSEQELGDLEPPFLHSYPARLPDGRYLLLPLRQLPTDPNSAVASFIANHAAFSVIDVLADFMADKARSLKPNMVVGLPTLGLTFAPKVAERLGFDQYVPLGYSRKYWYDQALSVPVSSVTSPDAAKKLYIDPHIVPRLKDRRVVVVDDAVSTGRTTKSALDLLEMLSVEVVGVVVAMLQGTQWQVTSNTKGDNEAQRMNGVFFSPRFVCRDDGCWPDA